MSGGTELGGVNLADETFDRESPLADAGNYCGRRFSRGESNRPHLELNRFGVSSEAHPWFTPRVKLFYTGQVINTEMLVVMLKKHDIAATQEFVDPAAPDDGDLNRLATVFVPEADYERAHRLFYAEREDEF